MIEIYTWIGTLFLVSVAYLALALRYHLTSDYRSAIPLTNKNFVARLATTGAISYFMFGFLGVFGLANFAHLVPQLLLVLKEWWIVEIFIVWNIRTAFLIFLNIGRLKVSI